MSGVLGLAACFVCLGTPQVSGLWKASPPTDASDVVKAIWRTGWLRLRPDGTYTLYDMESKGRYRVEGTTVTLVPESAFERESDHPAFLMLGTQMAGLFDPTSDGLLLVSPARIMPKGGLRFVKPPPQPTWKLIAMMDRYDNPVLAEMAWDELKENADSRANDFAYYLSTPKRVGIKWWCLVFLGYSHSPRASNEMAAAILGSERRLKSAALLALRTYRDPTLVPLLVQTADESRFAPQVMQALGTQGGSEAVACLRSHLKDRFGYTRRYAVQSLAKLKVVSAVPEILPLIRDREPMVRIEAVKALQALDPQNKAILASLPDILKTLSGGGWMDQSSAAEVLRAMRGPGVYEALAKVMGNPMFPVRREAATALGDLGDPRALPILGKHLWDETPDVQNACAKAIVQIRRRQGKPVGRELQGEQMVELLKRMMKAHRK